MNYQQQAQDFLTATATTLTVDFLKFDKHFDDDKEKRNIFKVTLANTRGAMSFNFGDSIANSQIKETTNDLSLLQDNALVEIFAGVRNGDNTISAATNFKITKKMLVEGLLIEKIHTHAQTLSDIYNLEITTYNKKQPRRNHLKTSHAFAFISTIQNALQRKLKELSAAKLEYIGTQKTPVQIPTAYDVLACLTTYDPGMFSDFCSEYGYDEDSRCAERVYHAVVKQYTDLCAVFTEDELQLLSEIN